MATEIGTDYINWDHGDGVCKLILVPREEIDEGSDDPDAWDLIWVERSTNVRRFDERLDSAYGRGGDVDREAVRRYAAGAPAEAIEILKPWL